MEAQVGTWKDRTYRYFFDYGSPGDKFHSVNAGAFHSDEIEYVFGTLDSRQEAKWRPEDRALSDLMGQYWTNFAKTGDPNGPGLPKWPVYRPQEWLVMHLDPTPEAKPDMERARYEFLDNNR
jgi:para-nitrobenzyl esterase